MTPEERIELFLSEHRKNGALPQISTDGDVLTYINELKYLILTWHQQEMERKIAELDIFLDNELESMENDENCTLKEVTGYMLTKRQALEKLRE